MAKDAKGHGSEQRGGIATPASKALLARMIAEQHGPASIAAQHGIPVRHLAPQISSGPFKVQSLAPQRAGTPWATERAYGNRTVAERTAQNMRADGGYTRVKVGR